VDAIPVSGHAAAEPLVVRGLLTAARDDQERAAGSDTFGLGPGEDGDVLIYQSHQKFLGWAGRIVGTVGQQATW
jgi:hypothetical protein